MNIVNKLTFRHLKSNLKRTIVTLFGIIVSVAMVTAVFTSLISFVNFFKEVTMAYDGAWHAEYLDCTPDDIRVLKEQTDIEQVGAIYSSIGAADLDLENINHKNESDVIACDDTYLKLRNIEIRSGTAPRNTKEILVSQKFIDNNKLQWKVGDTVTVDFQDYLHALPAADESDTYTARTFTICGITKSNVSETDVNGIFCGIDDTLADQQFDAYVQFDKLDNDVWSKADAAKAAIHCEKVNYHTELFNYSGVMKDNQILVTLGVFAAIILVIIIAASVFMIYDSFAVSYQQRAKYLGMLASVGATKRQKRQSVYFEGFLLGIIGIPVGILAGIVGIAITLKALSGTFLATFNIPISQTLTVHVNPLVVVGSALISALTIFISSYIPARRASKTTAIEAIRQTNTVKVKNSKKLKTSRLHTKLFGFEGALAVKNFKRNGQRSRNVVFALCMSVVLFLSTANFTSMFTGMFESEFDGLDYDIYIALQSQQAITDDDVKKTNKMIRSISTIEDYHILGRETLNPENMDALYSEDGKKYKDQIKNIALYGVDDEIFHALAKETGTDPADYQNSRQPKGILINYAVLSGVDNKTRTAFSPLKTLTGTTVKGNIPYFIYDDNDEKEETKNHPCSVQIGAQMNANSTSFGSYFGGSSAALVLPIDVFCDVAIDKQDTDSPIGYYIYATEHEKAYDAVLDGLDTLGLYGTGYDQTSNMQSMTALLTIAKVFGYGFITLITLISILNIINTISTSMEERRREFAMIKSVGMTPDSFQKMIYLENIRYGAKALLWALPISLGIDYLLYSVLAESFDYGYTFHWPFYLAAILAVFLVTALALLYSFGKIKRDNIIETLKNDDI